MLTARRAPVIRGGEGSCKPPPGRCVRWGLQMRFGAGPACRPALSRDGVGSDNEETASRRLEALLNQASRRQQFPLGNAFAALAIGPLGRYWVLTLLGRTHMTAKAPQSWSAKRMP